NEFLSRPLILSINEKSFTILSKLNGDLKNKKQLLNGTEITYIAGGIKKVSAAASFFWEMDQGVLMKIY
ncbi:MAG TPA: hypothetical protein VF810_00895, partial [Patescibacteria group bacterium]